MATCNPFSPLLSLENSFFSFWDLWLILTLCLLQALLCSSFDNMPFKCLAASSSVSPVSAALFIFWASVIFPSFANMFFFKKDFITFIALLLEAGFFFKAEVPFVKEPFALDPLEGDPGFLVPFVKEPPFLGPFVKDPALVVPFVKELFFFEPLRFWLLVP